MFGILAKKNEQKIEHFPHHKLSTVLMGHTVMANVFFIVSLPDGTHKCVLSSRNYKFPIDCDSENEALEHRTGKSVTPNQIVYLFKEFSLLHTFRRRVYRFLKHFDSPVQFTVIEPRDGNLVDHEWCFRAIRITWEKVEIDNLMSWLSTLGGAFSALGDSFDACAERAGRISFYQLKLAMKCGDPSIIARCKLYYSISLIQKGKLRLAKRVILDQYEFAKEEKRGGDSLLYKMCHGIWLKLQYTHQMRKERKQLAKKKANTIITTATTTNKKTSS